METITQQIPIEDEELFKQAVKLNSNTSIAQQEGYSKELIKFTLLVEDLSDLYYLGQHMGVLKCQQGLKKLRDI